VRRLHWGEMTNVKYLQDFNQEITEFSIQSNFDKRDSLRHEKAYKREVPVRSDSCHRQTVTTFSVIILSAGAYACVFPAYQPSTVLAVADPAGKPYSEQDLKWRWCHHL
jgi:hypothetical protein